MWQDQLANHFLFCDTKRNIQRPECCGLHVRTSHLPQLGVTPHTQPQKLNICGACMHIRCCFLKIESSTLYFCRGPVSICVGNDIIAHLLPYVFKLQPYNITFINTDCCPEGLLHFIFSPPMQKHDSKS